MIIGTLEERTKSFLDRMAVMHPDIEVLGTYVNNSTKINCKCRIDGYEWCPRPSDLLAGCGCPECGKIIKSQKLTKSQDNVISRIYEHNPSLEVIGTYKTMRGKIRCKCKKCSYEFEPIVYSLLKYTVRCPYCANRVVIANLNDIATTHPLIAQFIKNKEDTHKYCATNSVRIDFKCPTCGDEHKYLLNQVVKTGYHCAFCDNVVSLPNRIIRNLLRFVNAENFEYEYSPEWALGAKYDATFIKEKQRYVVEMDGSLHFRTSNQFGLTEADLLDRQRRDREKDMLAAKNNCIMIRINCTPETIPKIKMRIQESLLSKLFDLSNVPWFDLQYFEETLLNKICSAYNQEKISAEKLSQKLSLDRHKVVTYLKRGTELGLCSYDPTYKSLQVAIKCTNVKTQEVYIYNSIVEAYKELTLKGIDISKDQISSHSKLRDNYKGYILERI